MRRLRQAPVASIMAVAALLAVLLAGGCQPPRPTPPAPGSASAGSATSPKPSTTASAATESEGGAIGVPITITPGKKARIGSVGRPSDATAIANAKRLLESDQGVSASKVRVDAATQDSKGRWWVLLSVSDPDAGAQKLVLTFDGKTWDDPVYGAVVNTTDLPPDVKF